VTAKANLSIAERQIAIKNSSSRSSTIALKVQMKRDATQTHNAMIKQLRFGYALPV
jgi:hypothetical protein